jgi:Alpha/beta hydrolase domain
VHGRPGIGVSIDGVFIPSARGEGIESTRRAISSKGERIRHDTRVPVLVLQSETDVILLGGGLAAQPDSERIRVWEMAGAAHADTYTISAGRHDDGTLSPERLAELLRPTSDLMIGTTDSPVNAGPQQHYVSEAALDHLVRWAQGGDPPPVAPRLDVDAQGTNFRTDEHGLALGGIRTPWVEVPTAVMSGLGQSGESFAMLFGRTEPFDDVALKALYPGGKDDYLERFAASLDAVIAAGFILDDDRAEILGVAAASYPLQLAGT